MLFTPLDVDAYFHLNWLLFVQKLTDTLFSHQPVLMKGIEKIQLTLAGNEHIARQFNFVQRGKLWNKWERLEATF